jgi:isoamylase
MTRPRTPIVSTPPSPAPPLAAAPESGPARPSAPAVETVAFRPSGASRGWRSAEGSYTPQGVSWIEAERAYNFAIYSKHAERVTLLLYAADDRENPLLELELDPRINKSARLWHCRLAEEVVRSASFYAYRIAGPEPRGRDEWHWFDPEKVLLDPYAQAIHFPPDFERGAAMHPGSNAGRAPLGCIHPEENHFDWGDDPRLRHESDLVIYELHVRGFTRDPSSGLDEELRGTFRGVVEKIPYLVDLGITAVELMPVFQWDPQEGNYWGYMPLSFFAPHAGFAAPGRQHEEFREMVRALHRAGIEVILDVVYNHTAESDAAGPVYSYKGIDNSTYYLMTGDPDHPFADYSGTGNTLHTSNAHVRKLVLDSLRYWVREMHVDGFRFDLASIFSRDRRGLVDVSVPGIVEEISSDPVLASTRLIAEPWDALGYHLGRNFPGHTWSQWNDRFRDEVRRFVRGDRGMVPALMSRLYGSADLFPDDRLHAFHAYQTVNYVTSHDGFSLYDLLAYEEKRNWANGHANQDGPRENYSSNSGWEGDEGLPPAVLELRRRQARNFCCLLLLSNGTPMLRMGDEFLQTQGGNNNPYNQDNPTTWLDWSRRERHAEVLRFFREMIAFRKAHPSISRSRFWRDDVRWYGVAGPPDLGEESRTLAYSLLGESQDDDDLYVMINASAEEIGFTVQEAPAELWARVIDTSRASPDDIVPGGSEVPLTSPEYRVGARSVVVLVRSRGGAPRPVHLEGDGR